MDWEWRPASPVRESGDQAELVAAAHPALGRDEEDGREEERGAQPHQLHRGPQTVPRRGEPDHYDSVRCAGLLFLEFK